MTTHEKLIKLERHYGRQRLAAELGTTYNSVYRWLNKGVEPLPVYVNAIDRLYGELVGKEGG